jgi:hypothetical protein
MVTETSAQSVEYEVPSDIRILVTIAWIAGPTLIFTGWFLASIVAGSQRSGGLSDGTPVPLLLLYALITSVPLVIISIIGGITAMLSDSVRTERALNLFALLWNLLVFGIYFGLFGITGTVQTNGFPVTAVTLAALIPLALLALAVPAALFLVTRHRMRRLVASAPAVTPPDAYEI